MTIEQKLKIARTAAGFVVDKNTQRRAYAALCTIMFLQPNLPAREVAYKLALCSITDLEHTHPVKFAEMYEHLFEGSQVEYANTFIKYFNN